MLDRLVIAASTCQAMDAVSGLGFRVNAKPENFKPERVPIGVRYMASDMPTASELKNEGKLSE